MRTLKPKKGEIQMRKLATYFAILAAIVLVMAGCQNSPTPVESDSQTTPPLALFALPEGAVFESATFYVYVTFPSNQTVNVYRVTDPWGEGTVTWNNFGGAYDATIMGSFTADAVDWRSVDLTSLVASWLNGTYTDYGILIDQDIVTYPRAIYHSREASTNNPYLEISYNLGGETIYEQVVAEADAYINQIDPDANFGSELILFTGYASDTGNEKQSLFWFNVEATPQLAALGDFVWIDNNRDGIQDEGEPGFPGVTVNLYDCEDNFIATTTTDENGYYLFDNLTPGDYYVEFIQPEGYDITMQDQGNDDALDSDADPVTGMTICTNLEAGETDLTWDCGLYLMEMEGCTLTIGFWKTHAGFGPQADVVTPLLPIWLGDAGGDKSMYVDSASIAHDILVMKTYGHPSNGITKLYAQMLGAKLNIANGADDSAVAALIVAVDAFLADNDWTDWDGLSKPEKRVVNGWKSSFDDYNNGDIGPGHCDD
jgi:hypothetical protein